MTTSVPTITFGASGFVAPAESAILAGVLADYNTAFGGNLNTQLETPQGQLASSTAAIIADANDAFLTIANGIDPAYADGRFQDAIGRIYFLTRNPASSTVVIGTCTGLPGVVIPTGALAVDTGGNRYAASGPGTIGAGGSVDIQFVCTATGAIPCAVGALSTIYQAIPGWDSVTNATEGVLGSDVEGRAAFEARREQSVAANALGSLPSILGAILAVPGVLDAYVTENVTAGSISIGGVSVAAHSLYASVAGGTDLDVATAIWSRKSVGCAYNGNTTVTVTDSRSGYAVPYPTYSVTFERPTSLPIKFGLTIRNSPAVPGDYLDQIQDAIIAAFAGDDGGPRARIGSEILALRFFQPVAALGAWAQIISLQIGTSTPSSTYVDVPINQVPTISASDIVVALV